MAVVVLVLFLRGGGVRVIVGVDVAAVVVVVAVEVVVGRRAQPPPICKHLYHGFWALENQPAWRKKSGGVGLGRAQPPTPPFATPHLQTSCLYDDLIKKRP